MKATLIILCIMALLYTTGCALSAKGDSSVQIQLPDPFAEPTSGDQ